jgi:hypothetical protein
VSLAEPDISHPLATPGQAEIHRTGDSDDREPSILVPAFRFVPGDTLDESPRIGPGALEDPDAGVEKGDPATVPEKADRGVVEVRAPGELVLAHACPTADLFQVEPDLLSDRHRET